MINEKEERREVSAGEVRAVFYLRIIALLAGLIMPAERPF